MLNADSFVAAIIPNVMCNLLSRWQGFHGRILLIFFVSILNVWIEMFI